MQTSAHIQAIILTIAHYCSDRHCRNLTNRIVKTPFMSVDPVALFKSAREALWPALTKSAFLERGVLTADEFVRAGDHLVHSCRSWSWESGDSTKIKSYLPNDKQFLVIRRVPCNKRINSLQSANYAETMVETEGTSGEWCSTNVAEANGPLIAVNASQTNEQAPADEYLDMEDDSLDLDPLSTTGMEVPSATVDSGNSIVSSRRYDVSITYDKYWQTPRIWLFGYDENGVPLPPQLIFEDIIQDYAKKTVTIEIHPHLSTPHGMFFSISSNFHCVIR